MITYGLAPQSVVFRNFGHNRQIFTEMVANQMWFREKTATRVSGQTDMIMVVMFATLTFVLDQRKYAKNSMPTEYNDLADLSFTEKNVLGK